MPATPAATLFWLSWASKNGKTALFCLSRTPENAAATLFLDSLLLQNPKLQMLTRKPKVLRCFRWNGLGVKADSLAGIPEGWWNLAGGEERQRRHPRNRRAPVPTPAGSRKPVLVLAFPAPLRGAAPLGANSPGVPLTLYPRLSSNLPPGEDPSPADFHSTGNSEETERRNGSKPAHWDHEPALLGPRCPQRAAEVW